MQENKPIHNEEGKSPPSKDNSPQQEPQLKPPSTDEPIAASETISEAEQPITHNSKPETSNEMEVHHHSHETHGKKNWKSYFWEFLMLFLAVFCGFLAEYQLEHKIERDREKKFIQTFIEDLKTDTAAIAANLVFRHTKGKQIDSLITLLSEQKIKGYENELYFWEDHL